MISFQKDEIYTATEVVRNFSSILEKVKSSQSGKIVILKNNKFEAVMLNMEEFEKMQNAINLLQKIYSKN